MNLLKLLCAIVVIFSAGAGTYSLLTIRRPQFSLAGLIGHSWLLGCASVSLMMWMGGWVCSGKSLVTLVGMGALALALAGGNILRRKTLFPGARQKPTALTFILTAILALQLTVVFWIQSQQAFGWDGLLMWEIKARFAFFNGGVVPLTYFSDPLQITSHQDYPLLLPLTETWVYRCLGAPDQYWVRFIFPFFYLSAVLLTFDGVMRLTGSKMASLGSAMLLFFIPMVLTNSEGGFGSGYCDFPLAVFYLACTVELLRFFQNGTLDSLPLLAATSGLLLWIKQDGMVLWLCFMLATTLAIFIHKRPFSILAWLAFPAVLIKAAMLVFFHLVHTHNRTDFSPMTLSVLKQNADRTLPILHYLGSEWISFERWGLTWIVFFLMVLYFSITKRWKIAVPLLLLGLLPQFIFSFTYLFSSMQPYTRHITSSISRLLLQSALVILPAMGMVLASADRPQNRT